MAESGTSHYGNYYWCAKVTKDLSPDGEIYVMADSVSIEQGALRFMGHSAKRDEQFPVLIIPASKWIVCYAASLLDGSAIAVEHWQGEVQR